MKENKAKSSASLSGKCFNGKMICRTFGHKKSGRPRLAQGFLYTIMKPLDY